MDVEYQVTREDLFAFQWRAATRHAAPLARADLAWLAAALLVVGLLTSRGESSRLGWLNVVTDLVGILVFIGCVAGMLTYMVRRNARRTIRKGVARGAHHPETCVRRSRAGRPLL